MTILGHPGICIVPAESFILYVQAEAEKRLNNETTKFAHDMKLIKTIKYKSNCEEVKYKNVS